MNRARIFGLAESINFEQTFRMSSSSDSGGWLWLLVIGGFAWWAISAKDKSEAEVPNIKPVPIESATENLSGTEELPELPPLPVLTHRYDFEDDGVYGYTAAVSEDDRKAGKAAGSVVLYRYVGSFDGKDRLEAVDPNGRYLGLLECARPCKAVKSWFGSRPEMFAYDESSIAGAAFWDVKNGFLKKWRPPAPPPPPVVETPELPAMPYYRDAPSCVETADMMGCDANSVEANAM